MDVEPYLAVAAHIAVAIYRHISKNQENEKRLKLLEAEVREIKKLISKAA